MATIKLDIRIAKEEIIQHSTTTKTNNFKVDITAVGNRELVEDFYQYIRNYKTERSKND